MSSLIITAPHSLCFINTPYRNCDTAAFLASHRLVDQLSISGFMNGSIGMSPIQIKYYPSTHHRSEIDLNRAESRECDYRKNLSENMSDAFLLIDIHSFERNGYGQDVDVVILDDVPRTDYGEKLYDMMKARNISVAYIKGWKINDITEEARHRGIPAIIIEYMELISKDTIDQINNVVVEWTHSMLK